MESDISKQQWFQLRILYWAEIHKALHRHAVLVGFYFWKCLEGGRFAKQKIARDPKNKVQNGNGHCNIPKSSFSIILRKEKCIPPLEDLNCSSL